MRLPRHFGTRHRAALGIAEETDCLVVVISEETGRITFVKEGEPYVPEDYSIAQLKNMYRELIDPDVDQKEPKKPWRTALFKRVRKRESLQPKSEKVEHPKTASGSGG